MAHKKAAGKIFVYPAASDAAASASNLHSQASSSHYSSTSEIPVPKKIIDQVIGQESSVELIRKAAAQKRNVLLVGLPGTGKSMLAQAMAEILPVSALNDVVLYPNESDQNTPKVRIVKAGEGKKIVQKARLDTRAKEDNIRLLGFMLPMIWFIASMAVWRFGWISDIVFSATLILGGFILIGVALGTQMKMKFGDGAPKLLIDNAGKKTAPFIEATGSRAGALLGDVRHDPLQSFIDEVKFAVCRNGVEEKLSFKQLWIEMSEKYPDLVEKHEKGYEAIVFPKKEAVFAYGLNDKKEIIKTRIYSMNRRPYNDEVVELSVGESKLTLTPEHKVITSEGDKKAENLSERDELIKLIKSELATVFS